LYRIKQSGSVWDYIDKFCELIDQLHAYSKNTDPIYYTTRFIDGLTKDIKYFIVVKRPKDLDTTCCLALLQEENDNNQSKDVKKQEIFAAAKPYSKGPFPLPRPTLQAKVDNVLEEKATAVSQKGSSIQEKLTTLSAYRMAKGLCRKCGVKWNKWHKCANAVQLNALHEVWDLFEEENIDPNAQQTSEDVEQCFLAIFEAAVSGKEGPKTLKIRGNIQDLEIFMLIYSVSSHSFINTQVAAQLQGVSHTAVVVQVQVANGNRMQSSLEMLQAEWSIQDCKFYSDLKVLDF
jgi:hypothetical protein